MLLLIFIEYLISLRNKDSRAKNEMKERFKSKEWNEEMKKWRNEEMKNVWLKLELDFKCVAIENMKDHFNSVCTAWNCMIIIMESLVIAIQSK